MIKGLLFDFDGLILDTEWPIFVSWQELYNSCGAHLDVADWVQVVGTFDNEKDYFDGIEAQTGLKRDWESLGRLRRQRELELIAKQPLLPGVLPYLQEARRLGLMLGIASSSPWEWVSGHLTQRGLVDYFDCIHTRERVNNLKPDPEPYLNLLAALRLDASQAIAFEDSPPGVASARRAGLFTVAVPNRLTRLLSLEGADLTLNSLAELTLHKLLQRVNGAG
jgi:HAD superfamily hydrolase (TIGR01509 family)